MVAEAGSWGAAITTLSTPFRELRRVSAHGGHGAEDALSTPFRELRVPGLPALRLPGRVDFLLPLGSYVYRPFPLYSLYNDLSTPFRELRCTME